MITTEYRNYELPADFPILALHGDNWLISPVPSPRLHFHNCVEIGLCRRGSGEMIIGEQQLPFAEGTVTFVAPHVSHTTWSAPDTHSLWSYLFVDYARLLDSMSLELPNYQDFSDLTLNGGLMLHPDTCTWAGPLVTGVIRELVDRPRGYKTCIRGLLLSLAVFLLRIDSIKNTGPAAPSGALTPALDYIRNHYAEDFYIESLADLCHLSPTHFRRLFQKQLGTTPLDFLHQVRIVAGCSLLLTSTAGIAEIAEAIGYSSLSCFNRHFLRFMGTSPSRWRRAGDHGSRRSVLTFTGWNQPESSDEILRKST
jgi:AraC-like DNA-binding protein